MMNRISKKVVRIAYKIKYFFVKPQPFSPLPDISVQKVCLDQLRSETKKLTLNTTPRSASSSWETFLSNLRESILSKDPIGFLSWPEVRKTMFYDAPLQEWNYLVHSPFYIPYHEALHETAVGNPRPYVADPSTSGNLVHHAYHIAQLIEKCGIRIDSVKNIVELGGGYGSMYRLLRHMRFKGHYTIFDLPEFIALQKYFLSMISLYNQNEITLTPDMTRLDDVKNPDLAIMTWSLSEMPVSLRDLLIPQLGSPKYFLIAYQDTFYDIDNRAYFAGLKKKLPNYSWHEHEIGHMPGNRYLFGTLTK